MSVKMKEILFLSLLLHCSTIRAEIDCLGDNFYCPTENTYLTCVYDETRDTTVTVSDRGEACPAGSICNPLGDEPCDGRINCGEKQYICPTTSSFSLCTLEPDGTTWAYQNDIPISCPVDKFCDNTVDETTSICHSIEEPATEEPATEEPATEEPTTEEPATEPTVPTTEEPTTEEPATEPATEEPATEDPTVTTPPALGELPGYTCAGEGLYPHPTDCRRYIRCSVSGSTYKNSQRQCSNDLVYHPDYQGCRADTTPCDNMEFKCVATGRFADPLNPSKYIWCLKVNGKYLAVKYTCPAGKIYDGKNACVEPIVTAAIETLAEDETLSVYSLSRRSLWFQNDDVGDDERYVESDEMVADRISLNSNEDASVYAGKYKYARL